MASRTHSLVLFGCSRKHHQALNLIICNFCQFVTSKYCLENIFCVKIFVFNSSKILYCDFFVHILV